MTHLKGFHIPKLWSQKKKSLFRNLFSNLPIDQIHILFFGIKYWTVQEPSIEIEQNCLNLSTIDHRYDTLSIRRQKISKKNPNNHEKFSFLAEISFLKTPLLSWPRARFRELNYFSLSLTELVYKLTDRSTRNKCCKNWNSWLIPSAQCKRCLGGWNCIFLNSLCPLILEFFCIQHIYSMDAA